MPRKGYARTLMNPVIHFEMPAEDMGRMRKFYEVVIAVEDINRAIKKVKESGGRVIGGQKKDGTPDDIPGVGLYVPIIDTEGNRVGVLEPKPKNM